MKVFDIRKITALFLSAFMLSALLCGCAENGKDSVTGAAESVSAPAESGVGTSPAAPGKYDISWKDAFQIPGLPDGHVTPNTAAFYRKDADGEYVVTVPLEEIYAAQQSDLILPRTHLYDEELGEIAEKLFPVIDYAMLNNYTRFVFPSRTFSSDELYGSYGKMGMTYAVNGSHIVSKNSAIRTLDDGERLYYVHMILPAQTIDARESMTNKENDDNYFTFSYDHYIEALTEARRICDSVPEGSDETQTALYLYRWLAENVEYDEKSDGDGYELLYDALVRKKTIDAGFADALNCLFNYAGIDCLTLLGRAARDEYDTDYYFIYWNVARIDGEYYYFDVAADLGSDPGTYRFFAVSQEELDSVFPRDSWGYDESIVPECKSSLWKRDEDESRQSILAHNGIWFYNTARESDPVEVFAHAFDLIGEDEEVAVTGETSDGWKITDVKYEEITDVIDGWCSADLRTALLEGRVRDEGGYAAYCPGSSHDRFFRIAGISRDGAKYTAHVYIIDPDCTVRTGKLYFTIGNNGVNYILNSVTFPDGTPAFGK
ncbi:MAG: hypothetical protein IJR90_07000 [Clostridia bacterium]|nr:hypothetical protein [Clostridia bacterium]